MAAKQCSVAFYKKGNTEEYFSYWLLASELPDEGITVATVVMLAGGEEGPPYTHLAIEGANVDAALQQARAWVAERHAGEDWIKLSNCP